MPVTLKMRLGWDDDSRNAPELARRAEAAGVQLDHGARPHALPVLQGRGRLGGRARGEGGRVASRSSPTATSTSFERAVAALDASGADAVMVGRGAQGRPWFPGQLAHYLATGETRRARRRSTSSSTLVSALYDEMLAHHGARIGVRHARKHLGWALDAAAETAGVPAQQLKAARAHVLTSDEPAEVRRRLAAAYDGFGWRAAA